MRRKAEIILLSVCSSILAWMILSFIDINAHNMTDKEYATWNAFCLFLSDKQSEERISSYYINVDIEPIIVEQKTETLCFDKKKKAKKKQSVSNKDALNLARIIQAENGGHEDDEALLLTGIVVLKRVKSNHYPDTIIGVISQKGQYSTYANGKFWNKPSKRSLRIAKKLLTTGIADKYPDNLVFQAEFKQGRTVYKKLGYEYFCLA